MTEQSIDQKQMAADHRTLNVYSIFDEKAMAYNRPFFLQTHAQAMRTFGNLADDKNDMMYKHPGDFKLYFLAKFDEQTGEFHNAPHPVFLASGLDYVAVKTPAIGTGLNAAGDLFTKK